MSPIACPERRYGRAFTGCNFGNVVAPPNTIKKCPVTPVKPSRAHVLKEAELLRRMVQVLPNGPLLDHKQAFGEPSKN